METVKKFGNNGKNIVFLPGSNIDIHCYFPLIKEMSKRNTIFAIDFYSLKTTNINQTKTYIQKYIEESQFDECVLIGHSFGADIVKRINCTKISKSILIGSTVFKLEDPKSVTIAKTLLKSIIAPIKYPKLFRYYLKADIYIIWNLITRYRNTVNQIKQGILNISNELQITEINEKNIILCPKHDELFPIKMISSDMLKEVTLVDGNHDWFMNDVKHTSKIIQNIIS